MIVLGLDTATPDTAVALLLADGTCRTRHHVPAAGERPGHVSQALPLAQALLDEAGLPWTAVDRIAAGTGPGTFTGLRIGLATARGLAAAAGVPLVGVATPAVLAAATGHDGPVLAVLDARRGEVFASGWSSGARAAAGADPDVGPVAVAPGDLAGLVTAIAGPGRAQAVGDGAVRHRGDLEAAGLDVPGDDDPRHRVDAAVLCRLGATAAPGPAGGVLPAYVRAPDAVPTAVREAARAEGGP